MGKKSTRQGVNFCNQGNSDIQLKCSKCLVYDWMLLTRKCKCLYITESIKEHGQRSPETNPHRKQSSKYRPPSPILPSLPAGPSINCCCFQKISISRIDRCAKNGKRILRFQEQLRETLQFFVTDEDGS